MNRKTSFAVLLLLAIGLRAAAQTGPAMGVYKGLDIKNIVAGDFDLDGLPDGIHVTANDLYVELNYGIGNLPWTLTFPGEGGDDVAVRDLDGDFNLDVIVLQSVNVNYDLATVRVLINDGFGGLNGSTVQIRGRHLPQVVDLNGDGILDLLADDHWNRGTAPGVFMPAPQAIAIVDQPHLPLGDLADDFGLYTAGDFDGDGDADLLRYRYQQVSLGRYAYADLLVNDGTGVFSYRSSERVSSPSFDTPRTRFVVFDHDQDGIDDFLVEDTFIGRLVIHLGDPAGRFLGGLVHVPGQGSFVGRADLDGDGDQDIVVRRPVFSTIPNPNPPPPSLNVIENVGRDVLSEPTLSTLSFIDHRFAVADLNLDGREDFVFLGPFATFGFGVALSNMLSTINPPVRELVGVTGVGQVVPAGTAPTQALGIVLRTAGGQPVGGETVTVAAEAGLVGATSFVTNASGLISIPLNLSEVVGRHRVTCSAPLAASRHFVVEVTPTRNIVLVAGFDQGANPGGNFPQPLQARVVDAAGSPVPGVPVEVSRDWPNGPYPIPGSPFMTDASGAISVTVPAGQPSAGLSYAGDLGDLGVLVGAPRAASVEARMFTRRFSVEFGVVGSSGSGGWVLRYHHEHIYTPLILMADAPQPATPSIFGNWYTSFLNPQPTLFILDGLGLTGPPVPSLVTAPIPGLPGYSYELIIPWNAVPGGTQVVFQMLSYDNAYPFPAKVGLSDPATVTF
ncbi:MAG: hypothetical protein H6807_04035 [Planctomycetes bacterium]|nr:hypothetical protein [Planctomycetota bacterium]